MSDPNTEIVDGYLIDVDTGEVLALAGHDQSFHVTDRTSAEWVLEKMSINTGALKSIEFRRAAVLASLDAQQREIERRADWLNQRFGAELKDWAARQLAGQKRKSLQLDWGKVGFRQTHGSVKVFDQITAVQWLQQHCPRAVQMEAKVYISNIPDELRPELPLNAFDYTPPENRFYVDGPK